MYPFLSGMGFFVAKILRRPKNCLQCLATSLTRKWPADLSSIAKCPAFYGTLNVLLDKASERQQMLCPMPLEQLREWKDDSMPQ